VLIFQRPFFHVISSTCSRQATFPHPVFPVPGLNGAGTDDRGSFVRALDFLRTSRECLFSSHRFSDALDVLQRRCVALFPFLIIEVADSRPLSSYCHHDLLRRLCDHGGRPECPGYARDAIINHDFPRDLFPLSPLRELRKKWRFFFQQEKFLR